MVGFKESSVCYADGCYWYVGQDNLLRSHSYASLRDKPEIMRSKDFQLNEPREGYYIPKSELDTEEKYNQAVEVFGLFGNFFAAPNIASTYQVISDDECIVINPNSILRFDSVNGVRAKVKLTFNQLMVIGELKRKMNERDAIQKARVAVEKVRRSLGKPVVIASNALGGISKATNSSKPAKKRKSKEAYRILESMGIEWDNVEGKWFKVSKEWL